MEANPSCSRPYHHLFLPDGHFTFFLNLLKVVAVAELVLLRTTVIPPPARTAVVLPARTQHSVRSTFCRSSHTRPGQGTQPAAAAVAAPPLVFVLARPTSQRSCNISAKRLRAPMPAAPVGLLTRRFGHTAPVPLGAALKNWPLTTTASGHHASSAQCSGPAAGDHACLMNAKRRTRLRLMDCQKIDLRITLTPHAQSTKHHGQQAGSRVVVSDT